MKKVEPAIKWTHIPYSEQPDFKRPVLEVPPDVREPMLSRLTFLYGESIAQKWIPELERILKVHHAFKPQALIDAEQGCDPRERFTETRLSMKLKSSERAETAIMIQCLSSKPDTDSDTDADLEVNTQSPLIPTLGVGVGIGIGVESQHIQTAAMSVHLSIVD